VAFFTVVLATVVAGGLLAQRFLPLDNIGSRALAWFGFLSFLPVCWLLMQQQLTMLVFLGWLGFAWFEMHGRHGLSGASLALALVKPQSVLLLLALLVWKRRWRSLRAFALAATPLVLLSLIVSGPEALVDYPRFLIESTRWEGRGVNALGMFGWNGLAANLLGDRSPPLLSYLPLTLGTLAAFVAMWRGENWRPESSRFPLLCAVTFLSAMLINPHFYLQDVTLLCLPLALAAGWGLRHGISPGLAWGVAAATWMVGMYGPQAQQDLHLPVFTPWIALLFAGVCLMSWRRRAEADQKEAAPQTASAA
jgi:hypothetical protein